MAPKRKAASTAEPKETKKATKEPKTKKETAAPAKAPSGDEKFAIEIEACKSCGAFKTRATKLQKLLEDSIDGASVAINTEKPRKGAFEVRCGDRTFVSLLDMPRPFTKLKALDIEALAEEITEKLKE